MCYYVKVAGTAAAYEVTIIHANETDLEDDFIFVTFKFHFT